MYLFFTGLSTPAKFTGPVSIEKVLVRSAVSAFDDYCNAFQFMKHSIAKSTGDTSNKCWSTPNHGM